ncbi:hypothetical protein SAMN02800694_1070 [Luteibacter sp. UNCMF331Sha3.1]|nr:hypothetical protein SAMN02800694_1070 [Luteibacter sp. UNCMF331Sha3.1]
MEPPSLPGARRDEGTDAARAVQEPLTKKAAFLAEGGFHFHRDGRYSPIVSSDALPPAAVVLMVSVRSPAKRSR